MTLWQRALNILAAMILQPPMIAAQLFLDAQRRLVSALVSIVRAGLGTQRCFGVEEYGAFGVKSRIFPRDRNVP
jgi:hypothetical protein